MVFSLSMGHIGWLLGLWLSSKVTKFTEVTKVQFGFRRITQKVYSYQLVTWCRDLPRVRPNANGFCSGHLEFGVTKSKMVKNRFRHHTPSYQPETAHTHAQQDEFARACHLKFPALIWHFLSEVIISQLVVLSFHMRTRSGWTNFAENRKEISAKWPSPNLVHMLPSANILWCYLRVFI